MERRLSLYNTGNIQRPCSQEGVKKQQIPGGSSESCLRSGNLLQRKEERGEPVGLDKRGLKDPWIVVSKYLCVDGFDKR